MPSPSYDEIPTEPRWAEILSSVYVGDELHFRLRTSGPFKPVELPDRLKRLSPKYIDALDKMQKADGAWRIYESEVVYH